ncbi:hypothetical protein [Nitrosomonas communis]|uniref:Uncharacterized protein n=1 Tax=Nitrosomonas communis TaxID=44574 RepID=A0A1I4U737_9PROT|nr:hypothetical protein [Nitrosomonas communis]SFM84804.1 hypothetical protein SAMN05421863_106017 [Nitrosomonas communis]
MKIMKRNLPVDILSDTSTTPYTDEVMADLMVNNYASDLIKEYWNNPDIYSVLDHSLLGLAVAWF